VTIKIPRKVVFFLTVGIAAIATAVGVAAWQTSGMGTAYAKAASASALTLSDASASTSADLYPGATGDVKVKLTNANSFPVKVTTVKLQPGGVIASDKGSACNASTGVSFSDKTGLSLSLAAGVTATLTVSSAISMSNASDNSCQGAIFSIPVDVTAVSDAS
jgi:hypothetical protein